MFVGVCLLNAILLPYYLDDTDDAPSAVFCFLLSVCTGSLGGAELTARGLRSGGVARIRTGSFVHQPSGFVARQSQRIGAYSLDGTRGIL